jgi:coniferyl-aldehyde dehydrogenase
MDTFSADDLTAQLATIRAAQQRSAPDYAQRMGDLARLRAVLKAHLHPFADAMSADFVRRPRHESLLTDGMTVLNVIDYLRANLRRWMKPKRGAAGWVFFPGRTEIRCQPLGVVGVISPWNYPVNLALVPLATAIAAGNHVMLKPSEHTPQTSRLLRDVLANVFPAERVSTVLGGADIAAHFAALPFDHLFFTGSTAVGRRVMRAAADNLTPVTLELGGKSPVIVGENYPVETAVDRIAAGKFLNAGQTCIAPDYVLVPRTKMASFVSAMKAYVARRYGDVADNPDYASIVNASQFERQAAYLREARAAGVQVIELATGDPSNRVLAPTLVIDPDEKLAVANEEIFGPILPLIGVDSLDEAIDYINARPRPLALYCFDNNRAKVERVVNRTIAGSVAVNDTVMQFAQVALPFGGVGASGMGQYHGPFGFHAFSKLKPVLYQARWTTMKLMRPPYRRIADLLVKFLTR